MDSQVVSDKCPVVDRFTQPNEPIGEHRHGRLDDDAPLPGIHEQRLDRDDCVTYPDATSSFPHDLVHALYLRHHRSRQGHYQDVGAGRHEEAAAA
ncbi:hypothetical protein L7F22_028498 [Adiantum nelumboides]|nr:hypothetical protein [Adiantum nelumboides]